MFTVTVTEKEGPSATLSFDKAEISIGRVKGNDIVLPKGNVSKRHSRIVVKDGKFIVVDLKSTNGTYVNGRKITSPQVIKDSDKVYIGDFTIAIREGGGGATTGDMSDIMGGGMGDSSSMPARPSMGAPAPAPPGPSLSRMPPAPPAMDNGMGGRGLADMRRPTTPDMPALSPPPMGASSPTNTLRPPSLPPRPSTSPTPPPPMAPPPVTAPPAMTPPPPMTPPPSMTPPHMAPPAMMQPPPPAMQPPPPAMQPPPPAMQPPPAMTPAMAPRPTLAPQATPQARLGSGGAPAPTPAPRPLAQSAPQRLGGGAAQSSTGNIAVRPLAPPPLAPPALYTPGAVAVPPAPRFVSRFDEGFASLQQAAADQLLATTDPRDLPTHYPPSEEDRERFEALVRDAVARVGGGPDLTEHLLSEAIGLGPLELLLDDESVEEIYVNASDQIVYRQHGQIVSAARCYSHPDFLFLTAQRLLGGRGDEPGAEPVDEVRFSDGTRVHIVMPPLAPRGPILTVRKARRRHRSLTELVAAGVLNPAMAEFLTRAVEAGRSIVIGGPVGSGRAELLAALGELIPNGTRIVTVEDEGALRLPQETVVALEAGTGAEARYDLRYLLRSAVRMRPERILVNALSGAETYDWVTSAAGGTFGSMATCHATSGHDLLGRLESLALLGAHDLSPRGLREQIARGVHLLVILHRTPEGGSRVQQIAEVQGVDLDAFRICDIFAWRAEAGAGSFAPTGYVPAFYEALRAAGMPADTGIFHP